MQKQLLIIEKVKDVGALAVELTINISLIDPQGIHSSKANKVNEEFTADEALKEERKQKIDSNLEK